MSPKRLGQTSQRGKPKTKSTIDSKTAQKKNTKPAVTRSKKPADREKHLPKSPQEKGRKKRPPGRINQLLKNECLIVGIGASAGGLEALEEFFTQMPSDSGLAFIVVPHLHPGHISLLPSLLQKCTSMPVLEVQDGVTVQPNTIYVTVPGKHLGILNRILHLIEPDSSAHVPLPIDYFFRSLALDQQQQAIGIILSGTGSDGTMGLKAIKGMSGMAMAQEPQSAKYGGMPHSAIATGSVDYVSPPADMSKHLLDYVKGPYLVPAPSDPKLEKDADQILQKIFMLLRDRMGNDFSLYKTNTVRRRIERRMSVHQIDSLKQYLRYLIPNAHELDTLFQEILIGVTSFFRDPEAFEMVAKEWLPTLLKTKQDGDTIRVWVPGCGTGEEAYTWGILIREYMDTRPVRLHVQIFGTDLDERAIQVARKGIYPSGIANDVNKERLHRFFYKEDHRFCIKKEVREMVVFAPHNLLTDPPFTKLDILSCRNLLIYFEAHVQHRLFPLFHYTLNTNGLLMLGSSETIGKFEGNLFEADQRKWKLFTRTAGEPDSTVLQRFSSGNPKVRADLDLDLDHTQPSPAPPITNLIETLLLEEYAPASVIVNERGEIIYIHGRTGAYLEPAQGQPNLILLNMAREGLRHELAAALSQANQQTGPVHYHGVRVQTNGGHAAVDLRVKRVNEPEALRGLLIVTFEPKGEKSQKSPKVKQSSRKGQSEAVPDASVLQELHYTKQQLQHANEELQTSNEELKSTNEELQSTNEELQSTNEELESSKEELQSLNEELVTVNAELQIKIDELSDVNDDLNNLLNSLEVATIFLDNSLNIKRFTREAKRVVKVIATDVGRPLADIVSNLIGGSLIEDAQEVLRTLVLQEYEVQTRDGLWFYLRILPYRTGKNTIDGVVMTFLNITPVKQAEILAHEAQTYAQSIIETVREPLLVLDGELRVISANRAFYQTFSLSPEHVEQKVLFRVGHEEWDIPALRELLEKVLPHNSIFQDFPVEQVSTHTGKRTFMLNARRILQESNKIPLILLAMEDVTTRGV